MGKNDGHAVGMRRPCVDKANSKPVDSCEAQPRHCCAGVAALVQARVAPSRWRWQARSGERPARLGGAPVRDQRLYRGRGTALPPIIGGLAFWLVHFLAPEGVLAIWVEPCAHADHRKLVSALERLGFLVEAGTRCENGLALSARRRDLSDIAKAA